MYNINMYGFNQNWWATPKKDEGYKAPDKCTFCGVEIKDGDFFYAGVDSHKIYSETCDNLKCHTWLVQKIRIKKMPGKNYEKEIKERYEKDL